ncbi:hypothetical protein [Gryllotalpicola koreensis]|uniref:Uncharacterized protein n=1 Tax=Gryllotalpicola koreensis TaxID=993086 RepID=A0ABP8A2M8_9MICO
MSTLHLWRAIALEDQHLDWTDEIFVTVGDTLGRQSGYLSRSAAVDAGKRSGLKFKVVKSDPITFPIDPDVEAIELRAQVAGLKEQLAQIRSGDRP